MEELINQAKIIICRRIYTKSDVFKILCALNFLNAAVKVKENKSFVSYNDFKPKVSALVNHLISHLNDKLVDDMYYSTQEGCMYIRCYGIQFSFHQIPVTNAISHYLSQGMNHPVPWDGIRLQPIANELYDLAIKLDKKEILESQIPVEFHKILFI